jgi:hypothetical protein
MKTSRGSPRPSAQSPELHAQGAAKSCTDRIRDIGIVGQSVGDAVALPEAGNPGADRGDNA